MKILHMERNQPALTPCFAGDFSPFWLCSNRYTDWAAGTNTDREVRSWDAVRLPQAHLESPCQEEGEAVKMHPSNSLCHLVNKTKTEAPKPNTLLCKLSCCLELRDSCWRNRACVINRAKEVKERLESLPLGNYSQLFISLQAFMFTKACHKHRN